MFCYVQDKVFIDCHRVRELLSSVEIEIIDLTLVNLFLYNVYVSHQGSRRLCLILILFNNSFNMINYY